MPLPTPEGEERDEFLSRCMGELRDEFPDQGQRYAVCLRQWEGKTQEVRMERKTVNFELKAIDEEAGIFEGYAATFSDIPDAYGDVIERGAFATTIKERGHKVKILWNHNVDQPIGKPLELREDEHGLWVKGKLSLGVQKAREVFALMKDGVINEMSIGYETIKQVGQSGVRHLQELKLFDTSPVTFAANPEAVVTGVKTKDIEDIKAEIAHIKNLLNDSNAKGTGNTEPDAMDKSEIDLEAAVAALTAYSEGVDVRDAEAKIDAILATLK